MATHDTEGREYAKLSEMSLGSTVEADAGFTCIKSGARLHVQQWLADGSFYVVCDEGTHNLDGQLNSDDHDSLIGFYNVTGE